MNGKIWTESENDFLKERFPFTKTIDICKELDRSYRSVAAQANILGLKKDSEFLKAQLKLGYAALLEKGAAYRFKKGDKPVNKGKKQHEYMSPEAIERTAKTRFKKGQLPPNTHYDGHERVSVEGYVEIRVALGFYKLKHRLVWEQHHGHIPEGMIVVFKDGNRQNCDINNLELISKKENMARNTIHNYPEEIAKTVQLMGVVTRKINQKLRKNEKQD